MDMFRPKWYPFDQYPESDSNWALSTGPDGRIYTAACCEHTGGGTVKLVRYNDETDTLDYLFDLSEMVDDPFDSGRAAQCKIHYSFAPSLKDGILFMATHLSAPPLGKVMYSPWGEWHEDTAFLGSKLLAFDTNTDRVLHDDILFAKEGCRCLCHDESRGLLYAVSYPRDHLYVYDRDTRRTKDLGRIGSVNSQVVFTDSLHRVWTSDDDGYMIRYDPDTSRLERSPDPLPHYPAFRGGYHSVFYDLALSPHEEAVFFTQWVADPRMVKFYPTDGPWGRCLDFGPVTQGSDDTSYPLSTGIEHAGGLVFAADGYLYYAASRWGAEIPPDASPLQNGEKRRLQSVVRRMEPETGETEAVVTLDRPDGLSHYIARGGIDRHGSLYFAVSASPPPCGIFRVEVPESLKKENAHLPLRYWG